MGIIKQTIKKILIFYGFYKKKELWPKIPKKKMEYLIQNIVIKSSIETLNDIRKTIVDKQKGAYMRFGDGDIFLMLGKDDLLHKANKQMAKEMKEAIRFNRGALHKGLPIHSELFGYEKGMKADMHLVSDIDAIKFLSVVYRYVNIKKIYTSFSLHYLATFNKEFCIDFLRFLKNTNPIFVGNQNVKLELINKLFGDVHIKTPEANSYLEIDRIEGELRVVLDVAKEKFSVVVIAMGCPGRIIQKRILKKGYNVYLFDFGSLLDAFNDDNTRLWIDLAGGTEKLKDILNKLN